MPDTATWVSVALAALTLLTVIANAVIQRMRETRQRQWDLEDRKLRNEASVTRTQELRDDLTTAHQTIGKAIAANTLVTVNAATALQKNTAQTIEAAAAAQRAYDESSLAREEANGLKAKLDALGAKVRDAIEKPGA